jgi:hypothetical protein
MGRQPHLSTISIPIIGSFLTHKRDDFTKRCLTNEFGYQHAATELQLSHAEPRSCPISSNHLLEDNRLLSLRTVQTDIVLPLNPTSLVLHTPLLAQLPQLCIHAPIPSLQTMRTVTTFGLISAPVQLIGRLSGGRLADAGMHVAGSRARKVQWVSAHDGGVVVGLSWNGVVALGIGLEGVGFGGRARRMGGGGEFRGVVCWRSFEADLMLWGWSA